MQHGYINLGSKEVFFDAAYYLARGWTIINGTKYYFNEDGTKLTGTQQIDSETYYFNDDGALITGWVNENGKKYKFYNQKLIKKRRLNDT